MDRSMGPKVLAAHNSYISGLISSSLLIDIAVHKKKNKVVAFHPKQVAFKVYGYSFKG